jgi:hypothetical protein
MMHCFKSFKRLTFGQKTASMPFLDPIVPNLKGKTVNNAQSFDIQNTRLVFQQFHSKLIGFSSPINFFNSIDKQTLM